MWEGTPGNRASLSEPFPPQTWKPGLQPTPASPPLLQGPARQRPGPGCPEALCPLGGVMHTEMRFDR